MENNNRNKEQNKTGTSDTRAIEKIACELHQCLTEYLSIAQNKLTETTEFGEQVVVNLLQI